MLEELVTLDTLSQHEEFAEQSSWQLIILIHSWRGGLIVIFTASGYSIIFNVNSLLESIASLKHIPFQEQLEVSIVDNRLMANGNYLCEWVGLEDSSNIKTVSPDISTVILFHEPNHVSHSRKSKCYCCHFKHQCQLMSYKWPIEWTVPVVLVWVIRQKS